MKHIIFLTILVSLLILSVEAGRRRKLNDNFESSISMAPKFGCDTSKKIEIKDMIHQCGCNGDASCVWTKNRQPVYGCPCETPPKNTDYTCVKMAQILNCSDKKIECNQGVGQCECQEGGVCFWGGQKPLGGGCPCRGGRLPDPGELDEPKKEPRKKKNKKRKSKSEEKKDDL